MRPRFDADVIAALRGRVIAHNEASRDKTRLQELKKIYGRAWRGSEEGAMAAVDRHLLQKAGDFEEHEHRRGPDGRFVSGGMAEVRTRRDHERAREENAGYRAITTDVIPETRWSAYLPTALAATAAVGAGTVGAFPEIGNQFFENGLRPVGRRIANTAGQIAGRSAAALSYGATNAARSAFGRAPVSPARANAAVDKAGDKVGRATSWTADKTLQGFQRVSVGINRAVVRFGSGTMPTGNTLSDKIARLKGQARGRALGAMFGVANPLLGAAAIPGAYKLGQYLGPIIDAYSPRQVEKADLSALDDVLAKIDDTTTVEDLMKASFVGNISQALRSLASRRAPRAVLANTAAGRMAAIDQMKGPARYGAQAAEETFRQFIRSSSRRPFGPAAQIGGTIGAAALAGGAAYGGATLAGVKGNPYRDEEGRFTSKDKDARGRLTEGQRTALTAGAAAIGGVAALIGMRRANLIRGRELAARFRNQQTKMEGRAQNLVYGADKTREARIATMEAAQKAALGEVDAAAADKTGLLWIERQLNRIRKDRIAGLATDKSFVSLHPSQAAGADKAAAAKYRTDLRAASKGLIDGTEPKFRDLLTPEQARLVDDVLARVETARTDARTRIADFFDAPGRAKSAIAAETQKLDALVADKNKFIADLNRVMDKVTSTTRSTKMTDEAKDAAIAEALAEYRKLTGKAGSKNPTNFVTFISRRIDETRGEIATAQEASRGAVKALEDRARGYSKDVAAAQAGNDIPEIRILNPLDPTKTLPRRPTIDEIAAEKNDITDLFRGAFDEAEAKKLGAAYDEIERRLPGMTAEIRSRAPAILPVPGFAEGAFRGAMNWIAPTTSAARRDIERAVFAARKVKGIPSPSDVRGFVFGRPKIEDGGKVVQTAMPSLLDRTVKTVGDFKAWMKSNAYWFAPLTAVGSSIGVIDIANDGKVNFNGFDKIFREESVPQKYYRIFNAGRKDETIVWGAVVKGKDGQNRFLYADAMRPRDKAWRFEGDITPGSPVGAIESILSGGGQGQQGGSGQGQQPQAPKLNLPESDKKTLEDAGKVYGSAIDHSKKEFTRPDFGVKVRSPFKDGTGNDDKEKVDRGAKVVVSALLKEIGSAPDAEKRLGMALSIGNGTHLLTSTDRAALLVGRDDKPGGVLGQAAHSAFKSRDADRIAQAVETFSRENPDVPRNQLKQAVGVLFHASGNAGKVDRMRRADTSIDGAKPVERAAPAQASAPEPKAAPAPEPDDVRSRETNPIQSKRIRIPDDVLNATVEDYQDEIVGKPNLRTGETLTPADAKRNIVEMLRQEYELGTDESQSEAERWADADKRVREYLRSGVTFWKADGAVRLRKFDETKIKRNPKGNDTGGEFASKGASDVAVSDVPRQGASDGRSYFEPVRLLGTAGSAAGMQVAWDIAERVMPPAVSAPARVLRFGGQLASAVLGASVGQKTGEIVARQGYKLAGKEAPEAWVAPERSQGEELARAGGNLAGWAEGARFGRSYGGKIGGSVVGALAAEEATGAAYRFIDERYGQEIAGLVKKYL